MKAERLNFNCESCGKFIAYRELMPGGGGSEVFVPDTYLTREEHRFRCKKCTERIGPPMSYQNVVHSYCTRVHK